MTTIEPSDQLAILNSHFKNLDFNEYNLQVSIIEENAKSTPNAEALDLINRQLADVAKQKTALQTEIASVTANIPAEPIIASAEPIPTPVVATA